MQQGSEPHDDSAVVEADRTHANEPAFHQLVPVAVVWQPCQFLRRDETCAFEHRLGVSHGILPSS